MRITALITALVLLVVAPANAIFVGFDTGANNTIAGANPLVSSNADWNAGNCNVSADVGLGSLAAGDVDVFSVVLPAGCVLTAITTPLSPFGTTPDTLLRITKAAGVTLVANDDAGSDGNSAGPVRGSAVRYLADESVTYYIWVSGFPDFGWTGSHVEAGNYALTVSVVPEPATLALLAGGALCLLRRRR